MHYISYLLATFRRNKGRYIAFVLGFGFAIAPIFAITAYTRSSSDSYDNFYRTEQNDLMLLGQGVNIAQMFPTNSRIPENVTSYLSETPGIIKSIPMIIKDYTNATQFQYISPIVIGVKQSASFSLLSQILGIDSNNLELNSSTIWMGNGLISDRWNKGEDIMIYNNTFVISAIFQPDSLLFENIIIMEYEIAQEIFQMHNLCSVVYTIVDTNYINNPDFLSILENDIESAFPTINLLNPDEVQGAIGFIDESTTLFTNILSFLPIIIASAFIFVMMLLDLKDQEIEYGILQALGLSEIKMVFSIIFHYLILSFVGYLISILFGFLFFVYGYWVFKNDQFQNLFQYTKSLVNYLSLEAIIRPFIIAICLGLFISLYPIYHNRKTSLITIIRKDE